MKSPESIIDAQTTHLLDVVSRYEKEQCQSILEQATEQAQKIVKEAYQNAHQRTTRSFEQMRSQSFQDLKMAEASLQTEARLARHKLDEAFLEKAWEQLRESLCNRWKEPGFKENWIAELIRHGSSALISKDWTVDYSSSFTDDDVSWLKSSFDLIDLESISFKPQPDIDAGIRICAGGACIDGTIEGVLTQRDRIEEIFLASIYSKLVPENVTAEESND